jgi:hypothetical protein
VTRPGSAAQERAQPLDMDVGLKSGPIHFLRRRAEDNIDVFTVEEFAVPLEVARICLEVFVRGELGRVHENGDHEPVSTLFTLPDETKMTLVEKAHRRDEDDAHAATAFGFAPAPHVLDGLDDFHSA